MKPLVVLDAGHGGHDSGAVGPTGLKEKDVALAVVQRMMTYLTGPVDVILTRNTDIFIELSNRAEIANRNKANVFVSVHCNSADNASASGFEVFTTRGITVSDKLATSLTRRYEAQFPDLKRRYDMSDGDVDKEAGFTVLVKANCPAALFELEFISNAAAERFLADEARQDEMALALALGVLDHLGLTAGSEPPDPPPVPPTAPHPNREAILAHLEAIRKLV